jgi:hypothetical protein
MTAHAWCEDFGAQKTTQCDTNAVPETTKAAMAAFDFRTLG